MNRAKHAGPEVINRVSMQEIAIELGISERRTAYLLRKNGWWLHDGVRTIKRGKPTTYDAIVIEKLRGLLDQPHRQLEPPESDWLSKYLGGS